MTAATATSLPVESEQQRRYRVAGTDRANCARIVGKVDRQKVPASLATKAIFVTLAPLSYVSLVQASPELAPDVSIKAVIAGSGGNCSGCLRRQAEWPAAPVKAEEPAGQCEDECACATEAESK